MASAVSWSDVDASLPHRRLRAVFGGDTQEVVEGLTRPRSDERKAPAAKAPDVEGVPAAVAGESI